MLNENEDGREEGWRHCPQKPSSQTLPSKILKNSSRNQYFSVHACGKTADVGRKQDR